MKHETTVIRHTKGEKTAVVHITEDIKHDNAAITQTKGENIHFKREYGHDT